MQQYENLLQSISHLTWIDIELQYLSHFIDMVNCLVEKKGAIFLMDNYYVEAGNLPLTDTVHFVNTYTTRNFKGRTKNKIQKIPSEKCIRQILIHKGTSITFINQ